MFDDLFFSAFQHLKPKFKRKANDLAILYIGILQTLLVLVLGIFFKAFFSNMNNGFLSDEKFLILFIIAVVVIFFKNWIQYSGKKRKVLNTKKTIGSKKYSVLGLTLFPVGCIVLLLILDQAM